MDQLQETLLDREMPERLVNKNGKLVPEERPLPSTNPPYKQVERHRGKDITNALASGYNQDSTVGQLFRGAGLLGVGAPMSILDYLLDMYQPKYEHQDVVLPNQSGKYDPRLLPRFFNEQPSK